MEHIDIGYVVLHYLTDNDTIDCIKSIIEQSSKYKYRIVIVDNNSNNGSIEQVQDSISDNPDIRIIKNDRNLGFAKGNNVGINYLRSNFDVDFICLLNNDILLLQGDMKEKLDEAYSQTNFAVAGPMIFTADGRCDDNPGRSYPIRIDEVKEIISINKRSLFLSKWHLWKPYNLLCLVTGKMPHTELSCCHKDYLKQAENTQLHGCFLILSKKFFSKFDGLYGGTFLYLEEEILFYLVLNSGLKTVYLPDIKVFHKEDSASKAAWTNVKERSIQKAKYVLDSAQHLLSIMEDEE